MNGQRLLHTTLIASLAIETVGSLSPFGGGAQLPPPRAYVATYTAWFLLGLVAGLGQAAARVAGQLSVLILLSQLVLGPFGTKTTKTLDRLATLFPATTTTGAATS